MNLDVNPYLIKWYLSFLTNRTQSFKVNNVLSTEVKTNVGVPQGCVSSVIYIIIEQPRVFRTASTGGKLIG